MSREQYQIPTGAGQSMAPSSSQRLDMDGPIIHYLCGDCGLRFPLRRSDPIRCKECGCRILYKERTKRMVQFEAR